MAIAALPPLESRYAENIALLHHLGKVHSGPQRNPHHDVNPEHDASRVLSLRNERALTSTLAFLSSIKDDPHKITAVCVEETSSDLVVMVAVNAMGPGPSAYLQSVREGFEGVFETLTKAAVTSRQQLQDQVFRAVIRMCRDRVLTRTRLVSDGTRPRIESFLTEALTGMHQLRGVENKKNLLKCCRDLIQAYEVYRKLSSKSSQQERDKALMMIVERFHQLSEVPNLENILLKDLALAVPVMAASSRRALLNITRKIAYYWTSASTLGKFARRYAIMRRVRVEMVTLDGMAFSRPDVPKTVPTLEAVLQRIAKTHRTTWKMRTLLATLSNKLKNKPADFKRELRELLAGSKVHAEIQLIWHLQQSRRLLPPRVIASHKDACYLCNAFISLQGKYTIPGTHGRIYPGWRLPSTNMMDFDEKFVLDLEHRIVSRVNWVLGNRVLPLDFPLESTVPSKMSSMTTVLTLEEEALEELDSSESGDTVVPEDFVQDDSNSTTRTKERDPEILEVKTPDHAETAVVPDQDTANVEPARGQALEFSPLSPITETDEHSTSQQDDILWRSVRQGKTKRARPSRSLDLYVEYTCQPPTGRKRTLLFRASKLSDREQVTVLRSRVPIYDLSRLDEEVDCGRRCRVIYMLLDDEVFRVDLATVDDQA